ncbi:MAG: type II secretion system protein [Candidatus Brennerbacteria bacterium]|nr:type II secretion system protein [Candidatus Brennerbacteria bacterium]
MKFKKQRQGFTLIEILVYVAIFTTTAALLIGVLSTITRVQNRETASAEVSQQLEFVLQNIQRYVRESSNIDIPAGTATSTLKLRSKSSSTDPILIFTDASNTAIYIKQGTSASTTLTSDRVTVGNFSVTKYENPSGHATVQLDMTLNYNTAQAPLFKDVSRSLSTAIARVSAATFDSDLVPNADNTFSVGQTLNRWKNAFFDKIAIGTTTITNLFQVATATPIFTVTSAGNVGVGTITPSEKLNINGNTRINAGTIYFDSGPVDSAQVFIGRDPSSFPWLLLSAYGGTKILLNNNNSVSGDDLDDFSVYATSTSGTPLFRIIGGINTPASTTAVGFVGIGTSFPKSLLQVASNYIQFPTISGATPTGTDCDETAEAGRIVVRTDGTANLYICTGTGGWINK